MPQMTPMLKQYLGMKGEFPDAILFFRMGDFYEMFFEDARIASKILGITLTSRGIYNGEQIPMCGIPYHAYKSYVGKLVESGWKVAVCEQVEDPRSSKGIVKREVVRLVTPGSVVDEVDTPPEKNLYMAAASGKEGDYGLAYMDLSTGDFRVTETRTLEELTAELARISPAELLLPGDQMLLERNTLSSYRIEDVDTSSLDVSRSERLLKSRLGVESLVPFGCDDLGQGLVAAAALSQYVQDTQKDFPSHMKQLIRYHTGDFMLLNESTCSHLELLKTMRRQSSKGSLFDVLDHTVTPMGKRLLRQWITYPLIHRDRIRERLAAIGWLKENPGLRQGLRDLFREIYDMSRLNGRISMNRANARDLLSLKGSILRLPLIQNCLKESPASLLSDIEGKLDPLEDIGALIERAIHEDPPASLKEGGIIKEGYNDNLDRLIQLTRDGKSWITRFAVSEQKRTGISSLKVGYNRVFGYYIELSKANMHLAPPDYVRKQTLANGERYITEELKIKEEEVLNAEEKRFDMEWTIFEQIREKIAGEHHRIKETADLVAQLDVLTGLAEAAEKNNYTRPVVEDHTSITIEEGRHPVIECQVKEEDFVPNDIHLDSDTQQVLMITGPNMAGKSTILRQTALTVLMAQMGSFVPASHAVIGIVDRIFTRVGASDDLARGQSTFMVEMNETAHILRYATPKSLVILDEIGRGTSTYDGLSIAWAVAEALHDKMDQGVRTLFATHYHELTQLAANRKRVKNFNIAVREWNGHIVFLRKLIPGGTSRSYGIQVASIAGLPEEVIQRAREILEGLEGSELGTPSRTQRACLPGRKPRSGMVQMNLFESLEGKLATWIQGLDINSMNPLDALVELGRLKEHVQGGLRLSSGKKEAGT